MPPKDIRKLIPLYSEEIGTTGQKYRLKFADMIGNVSDVKGSGFSKDPFSVVLFSQKSNLAFIKRKTADFFWRLSVIKCRNGMVPDMFISDGISEIRVSQDNSTFFCKPFINGCLQAGYFWKVDFGKDIDEQVGTVPCGLKIIKSQDPLRKTIIINQSGEIEVIPPIVLFPDNHNIVNNNINNIKSR